MIITTLTKDHYPAVREIYEQGIKTGNATFQADAPTWESWDASHLKHSRLVVIDPDNNEVRGWAALTGVSDRCVYAGVAEVSVYVDSRHRGKGIGKLLLDALIARSEQQNIWTLQAGIFPENEPSLKIHESLGFRRIGYREKIGKMNGKWRDTVLLERRSNNVGLD